MPLKLATALFCAAALGVAQTSNPTTTKAPLTVPAQAETPAQPETAGQAGTQPPVDPTKPQVPKPPASAASQNAASQNDDKPILPDAAKPAVAKPTEPKQADTQPAFTKQDVTKPANPQKAVASKKGKKGAADDDEKPLTDIKLARKTYIIGPLDVLQIKVWRNADLSNIYDVRPDGMISMPLVGEVKADGLTVEELKAELNKRISDAGQKTPDVDVQVPRINSKKYYVTGGVKKTGEFQLPEPITVLDALMNTGGFTDFANKKKIFILRGTHKYFFNYNDVVNGKRPDQNIVVMPNDKIVIPE